MAYEGAATDKDVVFGGESEAVLETTDLNTELKLVFLPSTERFEGSGVKDVYAGSPS